MSFLTDRENTKLSRAIEGVYGAYTPDRTTVLQIVNNPNFPLFIALGIGIRRKPDSFVCEYPKFKALNSLIDAQVRQSTGIETKREDWTAAIIYYGKGPD